MEVLSTQFYDSCNKQIEDLKLPENKNNNTLVIV